VKKIVIFIFIMALLAPLVIHAQDAGSINRAVNEVLRYGINQHNLSYEYVWFDDFFKLDSTTTGDLNGWICTVNRRGASAVGAEVNPKAVMCDSFGGVMYIQLNDSLDYGLTMQQSFEFVKPDSFHSMHFEAVVLKDSGAKVQEDWIVGLSIRNTTPMDSMYDAGTQGLYFYKRDGDSTICAVTKRGATAATYLSDTVAYLYKAFQNTALKGDTGKGWIKLSIDWDTRTAKYFINDTLVFVTDSSACLPVAANQELTPTIGYMSGEENTKTRRMWFDYIGIWQRRHRPSYEK
jgi:hypothetical protein